MYDWSFVLGWLGVFSCLGGSFLFIFSSCCLANEKDREQLNNVQYIMPGVLFIDRFMYRYCGIMHVSTMIGVI